MRDEFLKDKIKNYYLIEKQKKSGAVRIEGYPYWLTVDPSSCCDLKCPLCPTGQGKGAREKKLLTMGQFQKIMNTLGRWIIHADFCNWGEPLMNKDIYPMISLAKDYAVHTKLDTNLNELSQEHAEKLVLSGLDKIILSIDGASDETYRVYRKNGDYSRVINNAGLLVETRRRLKSSKPYVEWQFLVFRHNQHEIERAKIIARELGVDAINFTAPYGTGKWLTTLEPYSSEYYSSSLPGKFRQKKTQCNWLWDAAVINSDGSVSPCCSVENASDDFFSSFDELPFPELWNSRSYLRAREFVLSRMTGGCGSGNVCLRCDHIGHSNHMDIGFLVKEMEGSLAYARER